MRVDSRLYSASCCARDAPRGRGELALFVVKRVSILRCVVRTQRSPPVGKVTQPGRSRVRNLLVCTVGGYTRSIYVDVGNAVRRLSHRGGSGV